MTIEATSASASGKTRTAPQRQLQNHARSNSALAHWRGTSLARSLRIPDNPAPALAVSNTASANAPPVAISEKRAGLHPPDEPTQPDIWYSVSHPQ